MRRSAGMQGDGVRVKMGYGSDCDCRVMVEGWERTKTAKAVGRGHALREQTVRLGCDLDPLLQQVERSCASLRKT